MGEIPHQVSTFSVLPVKLPAHPAFPESVNHYLYIQPHAPKFPAPDSAQSLFIANVPIDSTELHFRSLFADQLGGFRVARVDFDGARGKNRKTVTVIGAESTSGISRKRKRKRSELHENQAPEVDLPDTWDRPLHRSGSSAVVVFVDRSSAEAAMKAVKKAIIRDQEVAWGKGLEDKLPKLGSARYRAHEELRFPSHELLQQSVDKYMTQFGALESARHRAAARARQAPDDDGFITVTRGGGRGAPAKTEEVQEILRKQRERDKEKAETMGDFYRFQTREKMKAKQTELVRRFQEDREKVEAMRKRDKGAFKPL